MDKNTPEFRAALVKALRDCAGGDYMFCTDCPSNGFCKGDACWMMTSAADTIEALEAELSRQREAFNGLAGAMLTSILTGGEDEPQPLEKFEEFTPGDEYTAACELLQESEDD